MCLGEDNGEQGMNGWSSCSHGNLYQGGQVSYQSMNINYTEKRFREICKGNVGVWSRRCDISYFLNRHWPCLAGSTAVPYYLIQSLVFWKLAVTIQLPSPPTQCWWLNPELTNAREVFNHWTTPPVCPMHHALKNSWLIYLPKELDGSIIRECGRIYWTTECSDSYF